MLEAGGYGFGCYLDGYRGVWNRNLALIPSYQGIADFEEVDDLKEGYYRKKVTYETRNGVDLMPTLR